MNRERRLCRARFLLSLYFPLPPRPLLSPPAAETHLKIYPRFACPRPLFPPGHPRELAKSAEQVERGGGAFIGPPWLRSMAARSERKRKGWSDEDEKKKSLPGGGRLISGDERKKHGENAKCNPQSRRCSCAVCSNVGRKQCSRHSPRTLIEPSPTHAPRYRRWISPRWHTEAAVSSGVRL